MNGHLSIHHENSLYNIDPLKPLKPHFYIVKLGFTGVYIIFLISAQKHRLWVFVRTASPRRFLRVPTIYVFSRNMKIIRFFLSENFMFLKVKFSIYSNRHVFVMNRYLPITATFLIYQNMFIFSVLCEPILKV